MIYLTICQIKHLVQVGPKNEIKMTNGFQSRDIQSSWIKYNEIFNYNGQWCSRQMVHPMLPNWSKQLLTKLGLLTYQLAYLFTYLPTYLPSYILTHQPTYLCTYIPPASHLPSYIITYLFIIYLPTYLPLTSKLPFKNPTYLPLTSHLPS